MTLVPSNAFVNWSGAQFAYTPPGGTLTTVALTEIESVEFDLGDTLIEFEGDAAPGPTKNKVTKQKRQLTVVTADEGTVLAIPRGVEGTFTVTRHDAINEAATGGGGYTVTLANAVMHQPKGGGKHAEYGKATVQFTGRWTLSGGTYTDPLTVASV